MGTLERSYRATIVYAPLRKNGSYRSCMPVLQENHYRVLIDGTDLEMSGQPDIIMIDARPAVLLDERDKSAIDRLRVRFPDAAFMFLVDLGARAALRQGLKKYGTICFVGDEPEMVLPKLRRLLENLSLAEECGDRLKTLSSLNRQIGYGSTLQSPGNDLNVLVAGGPAPGVLRMISSLREQAFGVTAAITVPQTIRYLEQGAFDCLIVLPGEKPGVYTSLLKLLRRNDQTRGLPVMVFQDGARENGYRFLTQGADLVLPLSEAETAVIPEIRLLAKRSRLTKSMREFLRKSLGQDDARSDVACDLPFFENHLARQCAGSRTGSRHLCLSAFRLRTARDTLVSRDVCRQAVSYIEMLIQDTDLMTVVRNDLVLLSQPATALVDANRIRLRIVRLLQELKFKNAFAAGGFEDLSVASSTVGFKSCETPEEMITRALKSLDDTPRPEPRRSRPELTVVQ